MNKIWPIFGFVFTLLNTLDLILTLSFIEMEINPWVIHFPATFYGMKMISIFVVLTWSWYNYIEVNKQ